MNLNTHISVDISTAFLSLLAVFGLAIALEVLRHVRKRSPNV